MNINRLLTDEYYKKPNSFTEEKDRLLTDEDHKKHKSIALKVTILFIIFWLLVIYLCKDLISINNYVLIILLSPIIIMIYHLIIMNKSVEKSKSYKEEKKMIMEKIKKEQDLAELIPVAVFGLALLLGNVGSDLLKIVSPFLLLSIAFGTIIPFFVLFINAQDSSIEKLIVSEVIQFCSEAVAFGNLIPVIFGPFLILNKTNLNKSKKLF